MMRKFWEARVTACRAAENGRNLGPESALCLSRVGGSGCGISKRDHLAPRLVHGVDVLGAPVKRAS